MLSEATVSFGRIGTDPVQHARRVVLVTGVDLGDSLVNLGRVMSEWTIQPGADCQIQLRVFKQLGDEVFSA